MTTLRELFVKIVRDMEDHEDSVELSTSFLKEKLKRRYSRLQFIRPSRRNASEIVCVEETTGILADNLPSTSTSEVEDSEQASGTESKDTNLHVNNNDIHILYMASQLLKGIVASVVGLNEFWPQTASDIKAKAAEVLIPAKLFNFLAWVSGISDDVEFEHFIATNDDNKRKILSIAQDLVSMSSKGRRVMPKHVALGMYDLAALHWLFQHNRYFE